MAKSFSKLTSILLHPQAVVLSGKYKDCRLDSIMEIDPEYCVWMHNNKYWALSKDNLNACKNRIQQSNQEVNDEDDQSYLDDQYGPFLEFEDVPF